MEAKKFDMSDSSKLKAAIMHVELQLLKQGKQISVDAQALSKELNRNYAMHVFTTGQQFAVNFRDVTMVATVSSILLQGAHEGEEARKGMVTGDTTYILSPTDSNQIKITNQKNKVAPQIFKEREFNFEKLGIGGLDKQFRDIFRRAFASRVVSPSLISKLGISYVKGMLLYGPPGTGKTLIARQIGKLLNGCEPKVVNGPELLNKYVGQSEENMRNLFKEAEDEYVRLKGSKCILGEFFSSAQALVEFIRRVQRVKIPTSTSSYSTRSTPSASSAGEEDRTRVLVIRW